MTAASSDVVYPLLVNFSSALLRPHIGCVAGSPHSPVDMSAAGVTCLFQRVCVCSWSYFRLNYYTERSSCCSTTNWPSDQAVYCYSLAACHRATSFCPIPSVWSSHWLWGPVTAGCHASYLLAARSYTHLVVERDCSIYGTSYATYM